MQIEIDIKGEISRNAGEGITGNDGPSNGKSPQELLRLSFDPVDLTKQGTQPFLASFFK